MEKKTFVSSHASIYFVILSIICITFLSGCCSDGIDIKVKKNLNVKLNKYHLVNIVSQDYRYCSDEEKTYRDKGSYNSKLYLDVTLFGLLREKGLDVTCDDNARVDIKVECSFRRSLGCIDLGRHFNTECVHMSLVNLKFIDTRKNEIIGEVECIRPSLKKLPPRFLELMFDKLMKSGKIEEKK